MSLEVSDDVSTEMDTSTPATDVPASSTPEPVNTNVGEPAATAPVADPSQAAPATPAVPVYTPNFKYKVRDQEKEISEMYRSLIKDEKTEKEVKQLFEKAEGLDFVKQDRANIKSEYEGFKNQAMPYLQVYHQFTSMVEKGNLGAALQVAGITDEQIFEYAVQKLELEKNPHQAALYKNHQQASLRELELEGKVRSFEQQQVQAQAQQFNHDLDNTLLGHRDLVSQVDEKLGKMGAFKDEVITLGTYEFNRGNNLSIEQAVEQVLNKYKPFLSAPAAAAPQIQQVTHANRPATIPSVGASSMSAISQRPKSISDLRKLANEA